jgi:malonyl CoA-acyl carrier protein transacylase
MCAALRRPLTSGAEIRHALVNEATQTVRWHEVMVTLLEAGCRHFLELGAGRGLTDLVSRQHDVVALAADCPARAIAFHERIAKARVADELAA